MAYTPPESKPAPVFTLFLVAVLKTQLGPVLANLILALILAFHLNLRFSSTSLLLIHHQRITSLLLILKRIDGRSTVPKVRRVTMHCIQSDAIVPAARYSLSIFQSNSPSTIPIQVNLRSQFG
ncbi:COP9 signalosome complex subunit 4 [Fusarium oxysporum f. sp. albedinis]|nr:COP9 signalosome complex subunit 4 [Fusarium oxysporum f. sp. albedinis]